MRKTKIIVSFHSNLKHNRKFQKIAKKFKKLKSHVLAGFSAKLVRKTTRRRENKSYRFVPFRPGAEQKMPKKKKAKKIKKKTPLCRHFKPKQFGKGKEREKIKIIISFCPYLTHNLKFQNNCKKIQKIKKSQYGFI